MSRKIQQKLSCDWDGRSIAKPLLWTLSQTAAGYTFQASRESTAKAHPDAQPGAFLEELWRFEVAEIFFGDRSRRSYLEVNLAPNGAWWACTFTSPRERSPSQPDLSAVRTTHSISKNGWSAEIVLPHEIFVSSPPVYYNVTAILGQTPARYLSAFPLPGNKPDFHQPSAFRPFEWDDDPEV